MALFAARDLHESLNIFGWRSVEICDAGAHVDSIGIEYFDWRGNCCFLGKCVPTEDLWAETAVLFNLIVITKQRSLACRKLGNLKSCKGVRPTSLQQHRLLDPFSLNVETALSDGHVPEPVRRRPFAK